MFNTDLDSMMNGVPGHAMSRMNLALGSARLDPFDQFPIHLTSQHHRLLHHCEYCKTLQSLTLLPSIGLSIYAAMMFDNMHGQAFNPMRDV